MNKSELYGGFITLGGLAFSAGLIIYSMVLDKKATKENDERMKVIMNAPIQK